MGAYLTDNKPTVSQWYATRRLPLTGCTVLHTAESIMDAIGPDTGAEAVAKFIQGRTTAGSYHDLVDSDSWIPLVDLRHGAFHDGTGSNNWALSLSFACRTSDWRAMTPEKRRGFLHQGARAFVNQQLYRQATGAPLTRLRLISKSQSDIGMSGLTYHGLRDPGRRSDPGVAAPNMFPLAEFITECRAELARTMPNHPDAPPREDDMTTKAEFIEWLRDPEVKKALGHAVAEAPIGNESYDPKQDRPLWQVVNAIRSQLVDPVVDRTDGKFKDNLRGFVQQIDKHVWALLQQTKK